MGVEDAPAQQVEAGTTVHLALEHLEPVDVTFDWSITPGQAKCGHHGSLVTLNREREAGECGVARLFQPSRPGRDVALADDAEELTGSLRVGGQLTIERSSTTVRAQISKSTEILVHGDAVPLAVNEVLTRTLPNGVVERYQVLDTIYSQVHGDLPATTRVHLRKQGAKTQQLAAQRITYNVTGPNARVNIQSEDHSANVVNITAENLFSELKSAITNGDVTEVEKNSSSNQLMPCR